MRSPLDDHRRRLLAGLSDDELEQYIDAARAEEARLALQLGRDHAAVAAGASRVIALGKLRSRMAWTQLKRLDYRARQDAAAAELRRRRPALADMNEPAVTELERLLDMLGRSDP